MKLKPDIEHQKNQENSFLESRTSKVLWISPNLILIGSSSQVGGGTCALFESDVGNTGPAHTTASGS